MSGWPDLAKSVAQWASKADHDFRDAEYTLTLREDCPFDTVCFHAQAEAEGEDREFLAARRQPARAALSGTSRRTVEDMVELNRYSIEARYPGEWEEISRAEAERAVKLARGVCTAARWLLAK